MKIERLGIINIKTILLPKDYIILMIIKIKELNEKEKKAFFYF